MKKSLGDSQLRAEGVNIIFQILLANGLLALITAIAYFLVAKLNHVERFNIFAVPFMIILALIIVLMAIKYVMKEESVKGWYLTALAFASYIGFSLFYFSYDVAGSMILMTLIYMIATQIMMDFRITLAFALTGIIFAGSMAYFNYGDVYSVGPGYIMAIVQAIVLGGYAAYRYIQLLRNYQERISAQLDQLVENEERNSMLQLASRELMWDYNVLTGKRTFINPQKRTSTELLAESSDPRDWVKGMNPEDAQQLTAQFDLMLSGAVDYFEKEFRQRNALGEEIWNLARVVSLKNAEGEVIKLAGAYIEIHDKKMKELQIEHLAYYDEMTGLPNRSAFMRDIDTFLTDTRGELEAVLLYVDLQNFKAFNSSFGHIIGDKLIVEVANRLIENTENSKLYQLTSMDFGLLQYGSVDKAAALAECVIELFEQPFIIEGREMFINALIGISAYPSTAVDAESLLRNADTALYHCRKNNLTQYLIYTTEMTDSVNYRLNLNTHMRQALEQNEFFMVYQPLMHIDQEQEKLYGFEALIRWNSPQLGFVRPDHFIPLAEESGLIMSIGHFVLQETCSFLKQMVAVQPDIILSINLSAKQIALDLFLPELLGIVEEANVDPKNLSLEITETSFIESFESVQFKLNYLRDKGFKVALDDFGTGYSSLNYLGQLSIDTLKIDKSFTAKIDDKGSDFFLIKSIISLAKDLKINFVAEGVETELQLNKLKAIGCPIVQGYFFSRPLEGPLALAFLEKYKISN